MIYGHKLCLGNSKLHKQVSYKTILCFVYLKCNINSYISLWSKKPFKFLLQCHVPVNLVNYIGFYKPSIIFTQPKVTELTLKYCCKFCNLEAVKFQNILIALSFTGRDNQLTLSLLTVKNKQHHSKVLLNSFPMNGHTRSQRL